jgi:hypothetical protein
MQELLILCEQCGLALLGGATVPVIRWCVRCLERLWTPAPPPSVIIETSINAPVYAPVTVSPIINTRGGAVYSVTVMPSSSGPSIPSTGVVGIQSIGSIGSGPLNFGTIATSGLLSASGVVRSVYCGPWP